MAPINLTIDQLDPDGLCYLWQDGKCIKTGSPEYILKEVTARVLRRVEPRESSKNVIRIGVRK